MALGTEFRKGGNTQKTNEELEEILESIEKLLERTKVMYEQYFMGIQKMPPAQLHRDVERRIRELQQEQIRNTGLRFRFTTLQQKFGSYNSYWQRVLRQIEQGTYLRDIQRVSRKAIRSGDDIPEELLAKLPKRMQDKIRRDRAALAEAALRSGKVPGAADGGALDDPGAPAASRPPGEAGRPGVFALDDSDLGDLDGMFAALMGGEDAAPALESSAPKPAPPAASAARPSPPPSTPSRPPPPPPAAARPPRPPTAPAASSAAAPPPGMTEAQARDLYARYVKARQLVGQSTADTSYEKLMGSLAKQAPEIMKQHGAKGVEFNVVVKGDKVVLKAKPQK